MSLPRRELVFSACMMTLAAICPAGARAQGTQDAVALFTMGENGAPVSAAFAGLVTLVDEHGVDGADPSLVTAAESDMALGYVVTIDTDDDVVHVFRHSDGARFERRFEVEVEDSYALALVAAELLEVARSGGDPVALGLASTSRSGAIDDGDPRSTGDVDASETAEAAEEATNPEDGQGEAPTTTSPTGPALTLGVGAEAWTSFGEQSPWLVQPTLFFDVIAHVGTSLLVGGGIYASAFGSYGAETNRASVGYQRYDFGGRVTTGFDMGPVATRLLAHLRVGGSAIVGNGRTRGMINEQTRSKTVGGWFVGLGVDLRQPLAFGLELYLDVSADLLPTPATFLAFGETLVSEGPLRFAARLGFAWRIE